ncbi:MAG TPA: glucose-1-phosphate cytidylyltransferase [Balneolaceae bacterium]|nr:glucose-1-phosphate cytidylyltransferase [Balneolaceae bacterium]
MKTVILAGGYGTRISEETSVRPKPMVEIGEKPIIWHIMKIYSHYGINDFVICCGYKGKVIKEYFANYFLHQSDMTFDLKNNEMHVIENDVEPWKVTLIDTGMKTMTGGRLKKVRNYLDDETFCLTYGDGLTDLNIGKVIEFHKRQDTYATLTAVQPPGRFGTFRLGAEEDKISRFREKPQGDNAWINGGFFVLEPEVISYIEGDQTVWEREPLETLARDGKLSAYKYSGFWHPMDTLHDKNVLEDLWQSEEKPWKVWD